MPIVPRYDSPQVAPNTLPSVALGAPTMPDVAGQQVQQLGQSMARAGDAAGRIALDMQQQANQLRLDDAANQAKEAALKLQHDKDVGFLSLKGINALQRPGGKALADEYGDTLKSQLDTISASLGNDLQRQEFGRLAGDMLVNFKGKVIQHESQEFKTYGLSVAEGVQATALRDIGLNWKNPDAVNAAVERIQAETYRQAQLLGKSAEWQEAQARKLTSNAHRVALLSALDQNAPTYADGYLKKYAGQMEADDILAVRGHITKEMDGRVALGAATDAIRALSPRMAASDGDRAFNILLGTESGGKQLGRDGRPITSPKGAIGIAQVMPGTAPEAAKLAGLPWDEQRYRTDLDYNRSLGKAYFQKQLQDFGGNLAYAYAAYNAGPGAVRRALKEVESELGDFTKRGALPSTGYWLSKLPKETQNYVAKNMREFDAGGGTVARPTAVDVRNAVLERLGPDASPARIKLATAEAERQFEQIGKAQEQQRNELTIEAQRRLVANGGDYNGLPFALRSQLGQLAPDKVDEMMGFAGKIAKGVPVETDWNTYTQLRALAASQPDKFGQTDLRLYYSKLAPAQRETLLDLQTKAQDPKQQPAIASLSQQLSVAHSQLSLKDGDVRRGQFDDAAHQAIAAESREKKRELSYEERDRIIKRLMLPTDSSSWISSERMYQTAGTPKASTSQPKLGDNDRQLIVAALKAEGVQPTEAAIRSRFNLRYGIR